MRLVLAGLIWAAVLSGLVLFLGRPHPAGDPEAAAVQVRAAGGGFSLEITPTLDLTLDPLALTAAGEPPASLLVRLNGQELLRLTEDLPAGRTVALNNLPGLIQGLNEFYVAAHPALGSPAGAVRLRLLKDGHPAGREILWAEPGEAAAGVLRVDLGSRGDAHEG